MNVNNDSHETFVDRVTSDTGARPLGSKHPRDAFPAVVAVNGNLAEILIEEGVAVVIDTERETVLEEGINTELPYQYDLDFPEEDDDLEGILDIYRKIAK